MKTIFVWIHTTDRGDAVVFQWAIKIQDKQNKIGIKKQKDFSLH